MRQTAVLFAASVCRHLNGFHVQYLTLFRRCGYEILTSTGGGTSREQLQGLGFGSVGVPFGGSPC